MKVYQPLAGDDISGVAAKAIKIAEGYGEPVAFQFNTVWMVATADDDPQAIEELYYQRLQPQTICQKMAMTRREWTIFFLGVAAGYAALIVLSLLVYIILF